MIRISYPAFSNGVEIARMPNGAVASMLEKEATKNTIFFDDFTKMPLSVTSFPARSRKPGCAEREVPGEEPRMK
jgi:hypothetical protein